MLCLNIKDLRVGVSGLPGYPSSSAIMLLFSMVSFTTCMAASLFLVYTSSFACAFAPACGVTDFIAVASADSVLSLPSIRIFGSMRLAWQIFRTELWSSPGALSNFVFKSSESYLGSSFLVRLPRPKIRFSKQFGI
jgi:hypothetical protein